MSSCSEILDSKYTKEGFAQEYLISGRAQSRWEGRLVTWLSYSPKEEPLESLEEFLESIKQYKERSEDLAS